MDTEQQARLNFLEEAEEYFDRLESFLIDLDDRGVQTNLLDSAMRAAHSLKGGAAIVQFTSLSKIAHRIEDFLKILLVRQDESLINQETITLLLQGVDRLREVRNLYRQQADVDEAWLANHTEPIFEALRARLGDLTEEDEKLLLAEEERVDVSSLIFQSGVEDYLASFPAQIDSLEPAQLKAELAIQAEQLAEFGQMSQIEPFVRLCQSVRQQLAVVSLDEVKDLAHQALKLWERSQALVLVGRLDKLPTQLGDVTTPISNPVHEPPDITDVIDVAELNEIQNFTARELAPQSLNISDSEFDWEEFVPDAAELSAIDSAFTEIDDSLSTSQTELEHPANPSETVEFDLDELTPDAAELSELNTAFDSLDNPH
ncbi:MAG: Hpt domain-containing protein [Pleurocapsa sp. MO_226.B13]|nr:Hpt domain-containing protein [Pleurocapsa sp. MO_226.B13]